MFWLELCSGENDRNEDSKKKYVEAWSYIECSTINKSKQGQQTSLTFKAPYRRFIRIQRSM